MASKKSMPLSEHKDLHHDEYAWSLISPMPVVKYLPKHDDYIVYWNGVVMPHIMAFNIAMKFFGIYPANSVKKAIEENYNRLYYAGAFGDRQWDAQIDKSYSVFTYVNSVMSKHVRKLLKDKTPMEMLEWFDYKNAR